MRKISLKNVETKRFLNLVKRSSSMDRMMFVTVRGSEYESIAYNKQKTAVKAVESDLEKICESYENECDDECVKIQFSDASKIISALPLIGSENVNITFYVEDNNFAKKMSIHTDGFELNVVCADPEAVDFLTMEEDKKKNVFDNTSNLQFSIDINENEFKYIQNLFSLYKEFARVFFYKNGDDVFVSEIEPTDENVRSEINEIINRYREGDEDAFKEFVNYEKVYNKRLTNIGYENFSGSDSFLGCFNKQHFSYIDNDKMYTIEFHSNRIKFSSFDEENCVKTSVVIGPIMFS